MTASTAEVRQLMSQLFATLAEVVAARDWKHRLVPAKRFTEWVETTAGSDVARLPRTGTLIRGLPGVEVKVRGDATPRWVSGVDPIRALAFSVISKSELNELPEDLAKRAVQTVKDVADALRRVPRLRERLAEAVGYKTFDVSELRERLDRGEGEEYLTPVIIERLLREAVYRAGGAGQEVFHSWGEATSRALEILEDLRTRARHTYRVVAFLNSPTVDGGDLPSLASVPVGDGTSEVFLAQATDEVLGAVLEWSPTGMQIPAGVAECNSMITFPLQMDVDATVHRSMLLYPEAAAVVRKVVDLLRLVRAEDLGVNHFEILDWEFGAPTLRKGYALDYQREVAVWVPRRGIYRGVAPDPLSDSDLALLRQLAGVYLGKGPRVRGFDAAMRRFRDSVERYSVSDPERLLDLAIGLESLLLNDDPDQELSFRLALRGALLLRPSGQREEVFARLKDLYAFRSKLAHGGTLQDLKKRDRERLALVERDAVSLVRELLGKVLLGAGPAGVPKDQLAGWWNRFVLQ